MAVAPRRGQTLVQSLALSLLAATFSAPAFAQSSTGPGSAPMQRLGITQIFTNDWFGMPVGDRFDRWRTGAYQASGFWGQGEWDGALPSDPFDLLEFRFRAEIIAPDNLAAPAPGDRLYAPAIYLGAGTHFEYRGLAIAAGADLVLVGDQTGLMGVHNGIHSTFGGTDFDVSNFMVEDGTYLNVHAEAARAIAWGSAELRPFAAVQAGVETLARVGVDARFGAFDDEALLIRDAATGQRVIGIPGGNGGGWSFAAGGDIAYVGDTVFLPDTGPQAEAMRFRLRGGVNYTFGPSNFFYGITYLSEEFEGQYEGQLVGVMSLMLRF